MMNRRLRERLTEGEILQIFVDVCEGVAYMHNSRPPLLHRDLKVENILQSSSTSFKLCDFGSATTISGPPSNMQEIRALEADLNKHTTLQYRAPEMVDVYSKRPINEKSDIWALGVLLYKLCYYTTPFEEHGPLAILNVQYRTPAYPSYSQDMHVLIGECSIHDEFVKYLFIPASMLREHGAQRPTVFELLAHVHRLRGTKSKFTYTIPVTYPLLPPRVPQTIAPLIPNHSSGGPVSHVASSKKPALSMYSPGIDMSTMSNQGVQAREKVLEAAVPMRRGRPTHPKEGSSRPASPQRVQQGVVGSNLLDSSAVTEESQAWKAAKDKAKLPPKDDNWLVVSPQIPKADVSRSGFGDDFAEKLWTTSDPNAPSAKASPQPTATSTATITSNETSIIPTPLAFTGSRMLRPKQDRIIPNRDKAKDAFDGLGITSFVKPSPTLGEARKLRTGLAVMSNHSSSQGDYLRSSTDNPTSSPRPTPSPRQNFLSSMSNHLSSVSPSSHGSFNATAGPYRPANTPGQPPSGITDGLPIQSRFPSLEELDAQVPSANSFYSFVISDNNRKFTPQFKPADARPSQFKSRFTNKVGSSDTGEHSLKTNVFSNVTYNPSGVTSEHVGVTAKSTPETNGQDNSTSASAKSIQSSPLASVTYQRRPSLIRRHRSSITMKPTALFNPTADQTEETSFETPKLPSHTPSNASPQDWLTGDDQEDLSKSPRPVPVLRESPSKRASFISQSDLRIPEGSSAQHFSVPDRQEFFSADLSPTVSRFKLAFPDVEKINARQEGGVSSSLTNGRSPVRIEAELDSSSGDEGPEEAGAIRPTSQEKGKSPGLGAKGRQSSVHDLVNQYGGGLLLKERENESEFSNAQTPQDTVLRKSQVGGLVPPVKQEFERKTPSPARDLTPLAAPTLIAPKPSHRPQVSISTQKPLAPPLSTKPSSAGSRTRPQSMFIFPSQTADHSNSSLSLETTNLMPPEGSQPRPPRRLSISDMVQKYEAISAKGVSSLPPGPPSPVRSVSSKAIQGPPNGQKVVGDSNKVTISPTGEEPSGNKFTRPSTAMGCSSKQLVNNGELSSKQGKSPSRKVSDRRKSTLEIISSPRKLSIRAAPTAITSSNRTDPLATARITKSPAPQISPRKRTMSIPLNTPSKTKDESHSPADNEVFQGVSKLIDQWQKKSAEAEQPRPLPNQKRTLTTKRV